MLLAFRPAFVQAALFSLASNLLLLVPAVYMLQIYDRVLTSRNMMTLIMLTLMMLVLYVLMSFLDWMRSQVLLRIGTGIDLALSERVFTAAFQRQLRRQGGSPAQAMVDLSTTRQFLAGAGALAFFDAPWAPIYLVVIALIHPWLGVFSVVAGLILLAVAWLNEVATHKPLSDANREATAGYAYAGNNLRNAETIAALGMLPAVRGRWKERQDRVLGLQVIASDRGGGISAVSKAARLAFQSLILGVGAWLAIDDTITPGGMIAASILMGRALAPVELLIGAWKQWISASAAYERLSELLDHFPAQPATMSLPAPKGDIAIENLSAVPPGATVPALKNLSLQISAGDIVGVIGPTGAGKTTLAKLLVGVWPPAQGHVRLDGADVFAWPKEELGPHIGYLAQEIALFEGTVAENISRFGPLDTEKIVAAARLAGVHELILHLPKGYETQVGADGLALSGGQRQRIGLARALYNEPKLVVLDEPNSNLDEAGEAALIAAFDALRAQRCTVVFVSHGPRLVVAADKLLALRDGALYAYGPREKVIDYIKSQSVPAVGGVR